MSRQDLDEMITWETNNLYDYLRGLYAKGLEEAQAGHEFDKQVPALACAIPVLCWSTHLR